MSILKKIAGTIETIFQLGLSGPKLKNNASVIESRNAADNAFVIHRAGDPVGDDDLVTKRYGAVNYGSSGQQSSFFTVSPTFNGILHVLGWYLLTDSSQSLGSASPFTVSTPGYHSHIVLDVSGLVRPPFTIRITGTSVNESTGAFTVGDTEDISVAVVGYYQTAKSWITAVQVSIVEKTKACTVDAYRTSYWDHGNTDFTVKGSRLEWEPSSTTWSITLKIYHVLANGSYVFIDNVTFANTDSPPRAADGDVGKYKRTNYAISVNGVGLEGVVIELDQTAIQNVTLEVIYE